MDRGCHQLIDTALRESLAAFDDASLATLANPGLVRRAHRDIEEGRLSLVSATDGKAEVEADGQLVRIDIRGPKAADCACKSVAMCRHRIAAVLFLQSLQSGETDPEPEGNPEEIAAALDLAALERWAGKASWRAALELASAVASVDAQPHTITVSFEGLDGAVRILRGQGFDGIVSKAAKARTKAYHAAAVLAARQHFGLSLPEAHDVEELAVTPIEVDAKFLDRVSLALGEVAALGFNLAPVPLEESLFELSVSSRADSLPRLAKILRAIAAQIRLRRQRSLAFDPDAMLELTATAFALTRAIPATGGDRQARLAGRVRRDFGSAPKLSLIGCGGESWRTVAGARGVTAWFLEPETGRWLSTTLARGPGQDPQFSPRGAWTSQSLWQAGPLSSLAHARFELNGANISSDGGLSSPAEARATITETDTRPQTDWSGVISDWPEIGSVFHRQSGLGLDAQVASAACLLAPSQSAPPYFDDFTQQLVWPLRDGSGNWLGTTIDHEEPVSTAIEALEASVRSGWQGLVLVRIKREGDRLSVTPLTLFGSGDPVDLSFWQRPWNRSESKVSSWFERLRLKTKDRHFAKTPRSNSDGAIAAAWRVLLDRAEAGPGLASSLGTSLATQAERLDSFGLPTLALFLRKADEPSGLLAAAYALSIARKQRCQPPLLL